MTKERSGAWMLCEDCHRVLWVEDGPVCPECLAQRAIAEDLRDAEEWEAAQADTEDDAYPCV